MKRIPGLSIVKALLRPVYAWCMADAENWQGDSRVMGGTHSYGHMRGNIQSSWYTVRRGFQGQPLFLRRFCRAMFYRRRL